MTVYYVSAPALGMVKIGFATDHWHRLSKLQSDSPCELTLLAIEEGDEAIEAARHAQFAEHRERREWFRLAPEIEAHIANLEQPKRETKVGLKGVATLARNAGISVSYASMILSGQRPPSLTTAISIFRKTGRKFGPIATATDEDIEVMERVYGAAA